MNYFLRGSLRGPRTALDDGFGSDKDLLIKKATISEGKFNLVNTQRVSLVIQTRFIYVRIHAYKLIPNSPIQVSMNWLIIPDP